jgi:N-acetylneuraminic acid mutarotase
MGRTILLFVISLTLFFYSISFSQYNTWAYKSQMPTARTFLSSTVLDNKLYVIGGCPSYSATNKVEVYDPASDTWSNVNALPSARCYVMSCVYQNKIYSFGGSSGMWTDALNDVYEYDLQTGIWNQKSDMPYEIGGSGIAVVDNKIYIIGGAYNSTSQPVATVMAYDPVNETWTQKADLPTPRNLLSACVSDGKIYAIGGTTENWDDTFYKVVEVYDPTTNSWTKKADMPTGRFSPVTCSVDGLIYVIGGRAGTISSTKNEVYDPVSDTWLTKAAMQQSRIGLAGGIINNKIYVAGGHQGPPLVYLSSCEEYVPDISSVEEESDLFPDKIELFQNYPNPFNPSTSIQYAIGSRQFVTLKIYDTLSTEISTLVNEEKPVGTYAIKWNASNLPSGVYFYQLKAGDFIKTCKMILLK